MRAKTEPKRQLKQLADFPPGLSQGVGEFIDYLKRIKGYSPLTASNYQRQLVKLMAFCLREQISQWQQLKKVQIRQLSAFYHRQGLSPRSIALLLSACRSYFDYLVYQGVLAFNPAKGVKSPKMAKTLPKTVEIDQLTGLLQAIDDGDDHGIRDKAIAELFYSSGLRLAELIRLDIADIDFADAIARITGKGSKERIVPVGRKALAAIKDWLTVRQVWLAGAEVEALFISQRKQRLSPRGIQARMEYWGKFAGLNGRLHPHKFRHSCATHMLESSSDLRAVQELLGHANLSTTQVYTHLDFQQLAAVYDKAHPRAKK